jgi:NAD(P)-dependent dehydrogenase (short-subunit alcohol dehydrogenase family)
MKLYLEEKNAIITGGSAGIGFACAKTLVEEGANVLLVGRDKDRLHSAVEELKNIQNEKGQQVILSVDGDMTLPSTVSKVVNTAVMHFNQIDILINSAGSAPAGSFFELKDEDFLGAWNLKLLGYMRMVRAVAEYMREQRNGKIINIIGSAGRTPTATFLPGSTTNAALINFTKGISKELAKYNIRINAISPGVTATERANKLAEQRANLKGITVEEEQSVVLSNIPLGHLVEPDEIASLVALLVSDRVPSITGSEIIIDGGQKPGM